jgi:hypothetical protein
VLVLTDERVGVQECDVAVVEQLLDELLRALDPDAVSLPAPPKVFAVFEKINRKSGSAMTLLARRVEEADTWKRAGYRSPAEQLASVSGTSESAARTMLETSKQIEALPATADAMRAGKLSGPKAAAIASAATVAPAAEAGLLAGADAPVAVVRGKCLKAKAIDRDATQARLHRERRARDYPDDEGAWNFVARGPLEAGAAFRAGFDPIADEMFKTARAEGRTEPRDAYAFDALLEMARRAGEPATDSAAKHRSPRNMALVRIDHAALVRGTVEGDEICEIAGLGPIPATTARELLGDAVVKLVITKGVDVANVSRKKSHRFPQPGCAGTDWRRHECEDQVKGADGSRYLLPDLLRPGRRGARRRAAGRAVPQARRGPWMARRERLRGQ